MQRENKNKTNLAGEIGVAGAKSSVTPLMIQKLTKETTMLYYPTLRHSARFHAAIQASTASEASLQPVGTTYCTVANSQFLVKASYKVSNIGIKWFKGESETGNRSHLNVWLRLQE